MGYTEDICKGLNISEKERERRAYLSTLFQNAVSALDVNTKFWIDKENPMSIDLKRRDKWGTVYRMTLHLITQGDYDTIMRMKEEENKEYLIDDTDPLTVEAWVYISKFFTIVYNTWQTEQETARVVPVAKYLAKIQTPETPYYHNWIRSEAQDKAWNDALPNWTSLVNTLDEDHFVTLCLQLQDDEFITSKHGTVTQEAKAAQYMAKKYLDCHRMRMEEKHAALTLAKKLLDGMITE